MKNIKKSYDTIVLNDLSFELDYGEFVSVVGKSGSGKTTFLNILGLLEKYDEGCFEFDKIKIKNEKDYSKLRMERIGFIFQNYNLLPRLSCMENILLPTIYKKDGKFADINSVIDELDIRRLIHRPVEVLSGGEKQRVAIARSLMMNPDLLIADEPTGNLDIENRDMIIDVLKKEHRKGRGIVLITHDPLVANCSQRKLVLMDGKLQEQC